MMFGEGYYLTQDQLAMADPVSLKVALMSKTKGSGIIVFPGQTAPFIKRVDENEEEGETR